MGDGGLGRERLCWLSGKGGVGGVGGVVDYFDWCDWGWKWVKDGGWETLDVSKLGRGVSKACGGWGCF